ncbi:MAG: hypothetical protein ABH821_05920 [archaeon]
MNCKAFIGPIGDDLPSLIPLIFALVVFFSVFTLSFNVYDAKNYEFELHSTALRIGNLLKSDSYIENHENFTDLCDRIQLQRINYKAGLIELPLNFCTDRSNTGYKDISLSLRELDFYKDPLNPSNVFECEGSSNDVPDPGVRRIISFTYPVALQIDLGNGTVVKPMRLVVVVWN